VVRMVDHNLKPRRCIPHALYDAHLFHTVLSQGTTHADPLVAHGAANC